MIIRKVFLLFPLFAIIVKENTVVSNGKDIIAIGCPIFFLTNYWVRLFVESISYHHSGE